MESRNVKYSVKCNIYIYILLDICCLMFQLKIQPQKISGENNNGLFWLTELENKLKIKWKLNLVLIIQLKVLLYNKILSTFFFFFEKNWILHFNIFCFILLHSEKMTFRQAWVAKHTKHKKNTWFQHLTLSIISCH